MDILSTEGLTVSFGGLRALDEVDLGIAASGITGLIGPNGAGKTTFIDAVTGMVPAEGRVVLDGTDVHGLAVHERVEHGLVRTFQTLELFEDLTVEENLAAAAERTPWWRVAVDAVRPRRHRPFPPAVDQAIAVVGLDDERHRLPAELSHGRRRLVGVARALAASPRVLLLDEPAAGLDPPETIDLGERLATIAATGVAILLVDHDMGLILDVCDAIHVLDFGSVIAHGTPDTIRRDPAVVAAYLGTAADH